MKENKHELGVGIDVDETLILHNHKKYPHLPKITLDYYGTPLTVAIHVKQVMLLKAYKKRGFMVRVHSANGGPWATEVVNKLNLREFVDETETKLIKFVDDKNAEHVFGQNIYIDPQESEDIYD